MREEKSGLGKQAARRARRRCCLHVPLQEARAAAGPVTVSGLRTQIHSITDRKTPVSWEPIIANETVKTLEKKNTLDESQLYKTQPLSCGLTTALSSFFLSVFFFFHAIQAPAKYKIHLLRRIWPGFKCASVHLVPGLSTVFNEQKDKDHVTQPEPPPTQ